MSDPDDQCEFKIGDRVQLLDGGPIMRVVAVEQHRRLKPEAQRQAEDLGNFAALHTWSSSDYELVPGMWSVTCAWHDSYNRPHQKTYDARVLSSPSRES